MKALARKRRRKLGNVGRPRKEGERYANGNRKESVVQRETEKAALAVVIDARMRQFGLSEEDARLDLAGYMLGRMYLAGALGKDKGQARRLLDAGLRYAGEVHAYNTYVLGIMPTVQAQDLFRIKGYSGEPGEDAQRRATRITSAYMAAEGVLLRTGIGIKQIMRNVCVTEDEACASMGDAQIKMLKRGLEALAGYYEGGV